MFKWRPLNKNRKNLAKWVDNIPSSVSFSKPAFVIQLNPLEEVDIFTTQKIYQLKNTADEKQVVIISSLIPFKYLE